MKLHVLYDDAGTILAAVRLGQDESAPVLRPVPQAGQFSADLDVPHDCCHLDFLELCRTLCVDTKQQTLVRRP
jgi:hypothetical protein